MLKDLNVFHELMSLCEPSYTSLIVFLHSFIWACGRAWGYTCFSIYITTSILLETNTYASGYSILKNIMHYLIVDQSFFILCKSKTIYIRV